MSKKKKYLLYILYGILLTVGLLYYRFPSDAFREYIQTSVNRINPGVLLSIKEAHPSLPFGLNLKQTRLSFKTDPDIALFETDNLSIRPEVWSFLKGEPKYYFDCLAYNGGLNGYLHFLKNSVNAPFTALIKAKNVQIDDSIHLPALIGQKIKGTLDGTVTYGGEHSLLMEGIGQANLTVSDVQVDLLKPILNLKKFDFDELSIKIALKDKKIDIKHVELKGRELNGSLSGNISLEKKFLLSGLDLKGVLEPRADLFKTNKSGFDTMRLFKRRFRKGKIRFAIRGTLKIPRFEFM